MLGSSGLAGKRLDGFSKSGRNIRAARSGGRGPFQGSNRLCGGAPRYVWTGPV